MRSLKSFRRVARLFVFAALLSFCAGLQAAEFYSRLLNVNFGAGTKTGLSAIGNGTNDVWNLMEASGNSTSNNLVWATGTNTTISVTITNFANSYSISEHPDAMLGTYLTGSGYNWDLYEPMYGSIVVSNLPAGTYALYCYSFGQSPEYENGNYTVNVGTNSHGPKYTVYYGWFDPLYEPLTENYQYVVFTNVVVGTNEVLSFSLAGNDYVSPTINGLQIVDLTSTNPALPAVTFTPASGASVPVNVSMAVTGHGDATIYYTTNGAAPTTNSSVYSSAVSINDPTTVKAFATKAGHTDATVSEAAYVLPTLPSVTFNPVSGSEVPLSLVLSISGHGDATIYYTTNNTTPTTNSSVYASAISLSTEAVVKAFGVKSGYSNSTIASATYYLPTAPTPTIYPSAGAYYIPLSVTVSNSLSGATVLYSTNGSSWLTYTGAVAFNDDVTVWAKVTKAGYYDSLVATNTYTVDPFPIPATSISPNGGIFTNAATITLSNSTEGVLIEYRIGSATNWNTYSTPFSLDGIDEGTGFLEVRASKTNCVTSTVTSGVFVFAAAAPLFSHASGHHTNSFTLTLTNSTPGSTNFYSFDGTTWQAYTTGLTIDSDTAVAARTVKAGYVSAGHVSHQSWEGFSSSQGLHNWYYLYATNKGGLPASFLPLYDTTNAVWRLTGNNTNCQVGWAFQRPGETNDSVRSFSSPYPGTAIISGLAFLDDLTATENTRVRILKNDDTIVDWTAVSASTPVMFNVQTNLSLNDEIHFQVGTDESEISHRVNFYPQIAFQHYQTYTFQDTDGDGLSDALEGGQGTDPNLVDTDGDGMNDYLEWKLGRNPLVSGAVADVSGVTKLKTYTPLE
jgi:hypothetical protein